MGAYASTRDAVGIEFANTDQAAAWDGHEGDVWVEHADRYDRASGRIWQHFTEAQLVGRADRVLDVGCGTGGPTRDLARIASDGVVTGVDLSSRMLEMARKRSAEQGLDNVTFLHGDAQVYRFEPGAFDVAVSCFGAMFFNDPVTAFTNIGGGLRRDGKLALLSWRTLPENEWLMSLRDALAVGRDLPLPPPDAPTPFSLAEPESVRDTLGAAGFSGIEFEPIDEPIDFGKNAADAADFAQTMGIVEGLTDGLAAEARSEAMQNLWRLFEQRETADGVLLSAAAWLVTARKH